MEKNTKPVALGSSIAALLVVMFFPMFTIFGGLFPQGEYQFFELLEFALDGNGWNTILIQFPVYMLLAAVVMLVGAIIGKRKVFLGGTYFGAIMWIYLVVSKIIDLEDPAYLLDPEHGCLAFGAWAVLIIFAIGSGIVGKYNKGSNDL